MVMAEVLAITGVYDRAIDQMEYLLSIPSLLTINVLRIEPRYEEPWRRAVREHPRFRELLATKELVL